MCTARMTAAQNTRNCTLSCGCRRGSSRLSPVSRGHRPVVVLARAVDAGERLLVQQARQAVLLRPPACSVSIDQHAGGRWRGWRSRRSARSRTAPGATSLCRVLTGTPSLPQLALHLEHERQHALGDRAEVVVLELLALGRLGAEQRAAARHAGRAGRSRSSGRSGSTPARARPW